MYAACTRRGGLDSNSPNSESRLLAFQQKFFWWETIEGMLYYNFPKIKMVREKKRRGRKMEMNETGGRAPVGAPR